MSGIARFWRGLVAFLREIGDENAYRRYLAAHDLEHSGAAWRRFSDLRFKRDCRRARCC